MHLRTHGLVAVIAALAALAIASAAGAQPRCGGPSHVGCDHGFYCAKATGVCSRPDSRGVCQKKPRFCDFIEHPVCGCNGRTYTNACTAAENGINVARTGPCRRLPPPGLPPGAHGLSVKPPPPKPAG